MEHIANAGSKATVFSRGLGAFLRGAYDVGKDIVKGVAHAVSSAVKIGSEVMSGNIPGAVKDGLAGLKTAFSDVKSIAHTSRELAPGNLRTLANSQTPYLKNDARDVAKFAQAYSRTSEPQYAVHSAGANEIKPAAVNAERPSAPINPNLPHTIGAAHPLSNGTYSL